MKKSFRLTLACSAILFISQLSGMNPNDPNNNRWQRNSLQNMNNQNNPSNHSNQQDQPQQNVNGNNSQNRGDNNRITTWADIQQQVRDLSYPSMYDYDNQPPMQIPYNNAQGFGYQQQYHGRAVDVYNANNSYISNQPPMQIPMHFYGQPPMQMQYNDAHDLDYPYLGYNQEAQSFPNNQQQSTINLGLDVRVQVRLNMGLQQSHYQQQRNVHHRPSSYPQLTDAQVFQLWPRDLRNVLRSSGLSPQELRQAEANINFMIRNVSQDLIFISGDSLKNTPNSFVNEINHLQPKKEYADEQANSINPADPTMFNRVYALYRQFFIRLLWDLDSPEVRGWKEQWERIPGRENEKRRFNEDLANFIALTPYKFVLSTDNSQTAMNLLRQYQQTLEEGFSLLHRVADILRKLGLLAQQHQQIPLHFNPTQQNRSHFNPQANFAPNFNPNQPFEYTYQLPTQQVQIPVNLPRNSPIFQPPLVSISDAIRMSYSDQEQASALYGFFRMVNIASTNRQFISGDSSKNKPVNLTEEVNYLERDGQEGFGAVVASLAEVVSGSSSFDIIKAQNCLFLIRMLWILESPEARDWINHWSQHIQTQNMQDEQQRLDRFNQNLRNFIAQIPEHFVAGPNNQQREMYLLNQSQQLRQTGFSLLHYLTEITRNLNRI